LFDVSNVISAISPSYLEFHCAEGTATLLLAKELTVLQQVPLRSLQGPAVRRVVVTSMGRYAQHASMFERPQVFTGWSTTEHMATVAFQQCTTVDWDGKFVELDCPMYSLNAVNAIVAQGAGDVTPGPPKWLDHIIHSSE
jgi:hypothetical protein